MPKPTVIPMQGLTEAVKAGVVAAMEEREIATVNGGGILPGSITEGIYPRDPFLVGL